MTLDELVAELGTLPDATLHAGAEEVEVAAVERRHGIRLPPSHRELLSRTNGVEVSGGYDRLFGVGVKAAIDLGWWNDPKPWKFSWDPQVLEFFCFGEDEWGNQFAYKLEDLEPSRDPPVWFLGASYQSVGRMRSSLAEYLVSGFLKNARQPLSEFTGEVRRHFGDLLPDEHMVVGPPGLLSSGDRLENVMKMPAVMAQILNGDVWMEWKRLRESRRPMRALRLETWIDADHRPRVRLVPDAV